MRRTVKSLPTSMVAKRFGVRGDVPGSRDRVAVRAGGRVAEQIHHRLLDRVADDVLPLARLVVGFGPRQLQTRR